MIISADDLAWMKGEGCFVKGDTLEDGARKAESQGYRPGSQPYNAFLGGFSSMIHTEHHPDQKNAS